MSSTVFGLPCLYTTSWALECFVIPAMFRHMFIFTVVFFKPTNTSKGPRPGYRRFRVSVWVLCSGFLCRARNAQPACEIHRMVVTHCSVLGFHPTSFHILTKKEGKKRKHTFLTTLPRQTSFYDTLLQLPIYLKQDAWLSQLLFSHGCCIQRVTPWWTCRVVMTLGSHWTERY